MFEDHRGSRPPTPRDEEYIARFQGTQRLQCGIAPAIRGIPGEDLLPAGERLTKFGILRVVAEMAGHGLTEPIKCLLVLAHLGGEADDRAIGLELGK